MSKTIATDIKNIDSIDPKRFIVIKNAKVNNLHNLSVAIPRNKLVVITGLSGSGKSSLAFDTLFAEGQRMYVESLSSYARQFLGRMEKPEVDYIRGVSPAIAIEQKVNTRNPRSTVGTTTEIYDYLKLLFARIGKTYSPVSGKIVQKSTVEDVLDFLYDHEDGTRLMILCPLIPHQDRTLKQEFEILLQKGYNRVILNNNTKMIEDIVDEADNLDPDSEVFILIDRATIEKDPEASDGRDEDNRFRLADSIETAFFEGHGDCIIDFPGEGRKSFSDRFEADGIEFEEPSVNLFSFNNPYGACKTCEGFGKILGIDPDLVIPNKNMSVFEGAIVPWRSETMKKWLKPLIENADKFDFPVHRSIKDLTNNEYQLLWEGNKYFDGLNAFFKFLESKSHKIQYRVMLSRYRGRTVCPDCRGTRLRKDASYVKINDTSITDVVLMPVETSYEFFNNLELNDHDQQIANRLLKEVTNRLLYLNEVGLGYLTLNRLTATLSGGEYQRIKLATSLGSALVGSMYILDEPSIGLHPRDTERLVGVLKTLRDLGNTVIVVEHEEEVIKAADQIIDIGPDAGVHGGNLVFQGTADDLEGSESYTAQYLLGKEEIAIPRVKRKWRNKLSIIGARENNLKNIDVEIPLGILTVITGVSGSGKSTLVKKILYPALSKHLEQHISESTGKFDRLEGDLSQVKQIEFVDQNPIGKSSRSNPVTYVKAYDAIRQLFADQQLSKQRGFKPAHFSFNVEGGRCETCQGEGEVKIEMQFMADIHLTCESCKGRRFKDEVLEVKFNDKSIADVLDLTVEESLEFFEGQRSILNKLEPLNEVGLGYIKLGQSSNSLSGGEAQRVKLASFLSKGGSGSEKLLFVFDEPTTGLHFHDIKKLLSAINALIEQGNSVVIIEHNVEIIKSADWVIDLGPEGGERGGDLVFAGKPEDLITVKESHTARYLKEKFS
ncbi:excinuclease ABC subunit UvrA [Mangrovivirga sp. M17]|uniref:UvrABC system protein A n=1 Tax=Mangrovivirga halotolerans TaxID=2993936 RepID=A0ABT3RTF9_9BACT|nr:excinuclease ABC subunit UvrA [Mangrovivirga halotolerans]MCX2744873.1 excinuclease ABC subunit UvrA [Mangrovivirga halotolerans]